MNVFRKLIASKYNSNYTNIKLQILTNLFVLSIDPALLVWHGNMQQSRLVRHKYISIPGTIIQLTVNTNANEIFFVNNNAKLILTWMLDFNFYHIDPIQMTNMVKTIKNSIFWKIYQNFTNISWYPGPCHCKIYGGYLPHFKSRTDLEKLLAFLKISINLGPFDKIFIGLKLHSNKVSSIIYIS